MVFRIKANNNIGGSISLPSSKSISNRALIISALTSGNFIPNNLSDCDDTSVIISALRDNPYTIDIGAAGTAMRFMTSYLACTKGEHILTGTERMKHRPIKILVDALRFIGADIEYIEEEGYPPLLVRGKELEGGELTINGNISSQYISSLLMIAPCLKRGLRLKLFGEIASRPYIDLTLCMMRDWGVIAEWTDVDSITIKPQPYTGIQYNIENDWSAASYMYEIIALSKDKNIEIRLAQLSESSRQGDSVVRHIFSLLGVKTTFEKKAQNGLSEVVLRKSGRCVSRLEYDFISSPDLAQTFVVTCTLLNIPFHFKGLASLKIKETDRIEALKTELRKWGYIVESKNDSELIWNGERTEASFEPIDTYEDHRMAMAFAPASLILDNVYINNPQVVTKSFPEYWKELEKCGFEILFFP